MAVTREQFLKKRPLPVETVTVPNLGEVMVRGLSQTEKDLWESYLRPDRKTGKPKPYLGARMVQMCVVDENGDRIFRIGDLEDLGDLSALELSPILEKCASLSGFEPGEVEAAIKNSEKTPANDSGTS